MSKKTAKTKKTKKTEEQKWHDWAAKLPVGLFFTTMGPVIGKYDKAPADMGQFRVRLWAPAMLQVGVAQPEKGAPTDVVQQRVVFQPLALVETHIDLSAAAPYGRAPVPLSLLPGYEEYFAKFVLGEYGLRRVVAKVETGAAHAVDTPVATEPSKPEVVEAAPPSDDSDPDADESDETHVS